jgi:hypothetical protein
MEKEIIISAIVIIALAVTFLRYVVKPAYTSNDEDVQVDKKERSLPLTRMRKADLIELAQTNNIPLDSDMTRVEIIKEIKLAVSKSYS